MSEETLFQETLARSPAERASFLDQACAEQPELRAAVEALLVAHERSGNVLDKPPLTLDKTVDSEPGAAHPLATGEFTPKPASPPGKTADYHPNAEAGVIIAGRYTLQERIGEGGMGEVWVAKQTEPVKRKVALKLIKAGMDTKAVLQRFEAERQALALMDHPNIARVFDGGMTGERHGDKERGRQGEIVSAAVSLSPYLPVSLSPGRPYFVMELVNGLPLTKFCDEARLGIRQRLELFTAICQAVQHAHQKGIIHRDLKPSNILVTLIDARPVPKVIDFGVAKAIGGKLLDESLFTQFGAVVGTLEYMSPEQAGFSGADIDTRADIYSLGVILYELLTGLRPIDSARLKKAALTEMVRIIQEEEPSKPSTRLSTDKSLPSLAALRQVEPKRLMALLRGELDWVVMKCLEKQRDRRYETADALGHDIHRYLADEPVEARPPSVGYRASKFLRRNKGPVMAASLLFLTLVGGMVGTTWGLVRALAAEKHARKQFEDAEAARAEAAAAAIAEAEQRKIAEQAEDQTLADYRASIDEAITQLIGSHEVLGAHERAYLENTLARWQSYANRQGDDERSRAIRAEGHSRAATLWLRLGRHPEALKESHAARDAQTMLVSQFPSSAKYREDLGTIHNNLGQTLSGLGKRDKARAEHLLAKDVFKKLTEEFPSDARYQQFLAATHSNLGILLAALGESDAAGAEYQAGVKIRQTLAEQFPNKPGFQHLLARIHLNFGDLHFSLARNAEAEAEYQAAHDLCQTLVQQHPGIVEFQRELGKCHLNLGGVFARLGKRVEALAAQQLARNVLKGIAEQFPSVPRYQQQFAAAQFSLANRLAEMSRTEEARVEFAAAVDLLSRLAAQFPEVPDIQVLLGQAQQSLGSLFLQIGKPEEAIAEFESARDTHGRLAQRFPETPVYRLETARAHNSLANALTAVERYEEAKTNYQSACDALQLLVERYPDVSEYQTELGGSYCNLGMLILNTKQAGDSLEWLNQAIDTLTPVHEKEPRDINARRFLMIAHNGRAQAHEQLLQHVEAAQDWGRAVELAPPQMKLQYRVNQVFSQLRAGMVDEAVAGAAELARLPSPPARFFYDLACFYALASGKTADKKEQFADQAMELLHKAVKGGFKDAAHVKRDTDVDSLREREDFKKLVAELENKPADEKKP